MRTCRSNGYLSKFILQLVATLHLQLQIVSFIFIEEMTKVESEIKYDSNRELDVDVYCGLHDDISTAPKN